MHDAAVPAIYALNHPHPPLGIPARLLAALAAMGCLAVLITATRLVPDPRGVETHLQLGMAPCAWLKLGGTPCIACGMTTSYAHLLHGQPLRSLHVQPAGTLFALLTAAGVWIGGYVAATGRPSGRLARQIPVAAIFFSLLGAALAAWVYKIILVWRTSTA